VADADLARQLAQRQVLGAAGLQRALARLEEGLAEVAVVVGAGGRRRHVAGQRTGRS
jgi:hypothetical protein